MPTLKLGLPSLQHYFYSNFTPSQHSSLSLSVPFSYYQEMADAILFGLTQKMIENLASQAYQEIGSLWRVEDELEKIKNTVSTIHAVLKDAVEQQSHNHQGKDWLEKLNDAVYDADDLLSEFSTEATRRSMVRGDKVVKEVRTCFSCSNPLAFRYKMSRKIKAMRQKLNAIAEDKNKFNRSEEHTSELQSP